MSFDLRSRLIGTLDACGATVFAVHVVVVVPGMVDGDSILTLERLPGFSLTGETPFSVLILFVVSCSGSTAVDASRFFLVTGGLWRVTAFGLYTGLSDFSLFRLILVLRDFFSETTGSSLTSLCSCGSWIACWSADFWTLLKI